MILGPYETVGAMSAKKTRGMKTPGMGSGMGWRQMGFLWRQMGFLWQASLKGGSDGATNRAGRPQKRVTVSKSEFFFVWVFEGGGNDGKITCWKGRWQGNEYLKGSAGEMGQNGPCHDPCQLSPCSARAQQ